MMTVLNSLMDYMHTIISLTIKLSIKSLITIILMNFIGNHICQGFFSILGSLPISIVNVRPLHFRHTVQTPNKRNRGCALIVILNQETCIAYLKYSYCEKISEF